VRSEGREEPGARESAPAEGQATAATLAPPRAPAASARFESGTAHEEEGATSPCPEGPGPVTDVTPDEQIAGAAGTEAALERALSEVGGWPDYWRLTPWLAGLAGAALGAEVVRRKRRAAAGATGSGGLSPEEVSWGPRGLCPGEDF
jgi:hypothetical protein